MIGRGAAVDYGRRRVGLAVSDALGITVRGLPTFVRVDGADAVAGIAAVLRAEQVTRVVVGLPLHADGRPSEMSVEARAFGDALGAALGVPVVYLDEGLSSWEAEADVRARGGSLESARRSGAIDQRVAMGLLRTYQRELERSHPPDDAAAAPGPRFGDEHDPEAEGDRGADGDREAVADTEPVVDEGPATGGSAGGASGPPEDVEDRPGD